MTAAHLLLIVIPLAAAWLAVAACWLLVGYVLLTGRADD